MHVVIFDDQGKKAVDLADLNSDKSDDLKKLKTLLQLYWDVKPIPSDKKKEIIKAVTSITDYGKQKARLVDGGYIENSGISTAYEIGTRLEEIIKKDKDFKDKKIKVIYLAFTDKPSSEIPKAGGFNEVMSPLGAT